MIRRLANSRVTRSWRHEQAIAGFSGQPRPGYTGARTLFNQSIGRITARVVEFGHLTWGAPFEGATMAAQDEEMGFDIRYVGDNTSPNSDVFAEIEGVRR